MSYLTSLQEEENLLCEAIDKHGAELRSLLEQKKELVAKLQGLRAFRAQAKQTISGMKNAPIVSVQQFREVQEGIVKALEKAVDIKATIKALDSRIQPRATAVATAEQRLEEIYAEYGSIGKLYLLPQKKS